jgi:hypothetical protein
MARSLLLLLCVAALAGASRGEADAFTARVHALASLQAEELAVAALGLPPTEGSIEAGLRERIIGLLAVLDPSRPEFKQFQHLPLRAMSAEEAAADARRRGNPIGGMPGPASGGDWLQPHELRSMCVEMAREQLALADTLLPNPALKTEFAARMLALGLAQQFVAALPEGDDEGISLVLLIKARSAARFEPWTGRWNSPWGTIELLARGSTLVGRGDGGQLKGSLRGESAKGVFQFGEARGKFSFEMDPRGGRIRVRTQGDDIPDLRFCYRVGDLEIPEETP